MPRVAGRRGEMDLALDTVLRKLSVATVAAGATAALILPVWSHFRADTFARQGDLPGLERALEYEPLNSGLHNRLGRVLLYAPLGDELRARKELERAVALDPRSARNWMDLAIAQEIAGNLSGAAESLNRARQAEPRTPAILWHLANFELRRGETDRAIAVLRDLLAQAPEYTSRALPVFARAADLRTLVDLAIPPRADSLAAVMDYIRREDRVADASRVWQRALELGQPVAVGDLQVFLDWLLYSGWGRLAAQVWRDAAERHWIPVDLSAAERALYNGDFSRPLWNHGFDWLVRTHPDASVWIEARGPHPGEQSLCVRFTETARTDFWHVGHFLAVEPSHHYTLHAWLRSERLVSRLGAFLQVAEMHGPATNRSDAILGTSNWTEMLVPFQTGPSAELVQLSLRRPGPLPGEEHAAGMVCVAAVEWKDLGAAGEIAPPPRSAR